MIGILFEVNKMSIKQFTADGGPKDDFGGPKEA